MNETESKQLYNRVLANWNVKILPKAKTEAATVWHHFLCNVSFDAASTAIDARALAGGFPPRPGEIYTDVRVAEGAAPPSTVQALVDSKRLSEAIQHGTMIPEVHPLVAQTLADVGVQRDDVFQKLYDERRRAALADAFSADSDGGNMKEKDEPSSLTD